MWRARAACRDADPELFFPHQQVLRPPAAAQSACEACPVRAACLLEALRNYEKGVWGGTTEKQRAQLRRHYRRSSCPSCRGDVVPLLDDRQVCVNCGLSWLATKARTAAGVVPLVEPVESGAESGHVVADSALRGSG